jgi:hypothetical protein
MELQNDSEDLCASLNGRSVDYLIVGGYALAFHAVLGARRAVSMSMHWP